MNKKLLTDQGSSLVGSAVICNIINNIGHGCINVGKITCAPNTEVMIDRNDSIITVEWPLEKRVILLDKDNGEK